MTQPLPKDAALAVRAAKFTPILTIELGGFSLANTTFAGCTGKTIATADVVATLGGVVRQVHTDQWLSQSELSKWAQMSRRFVSSLEEGHDWAEIRKVLDLHFAHK